MFSAFRLETGFTAALVQWHTVADLLWFWQEWTATLGSHNMGYVMRANSTVLVLRLVWQTSLATVPFGGRFGSVPAHLVAQISPSGAENDRLCSKVCHQLLAAGTINCMFTEGATAASQCVLYWTLPHKPWRLAVMAG